MKLSWRCGKYLSRILLKKDAPAGKKLMDIAKIAIGIALNVSGKRMCLLLKDKYYE